jgi:hypothetical protein
MQITFRLLIALLVLTSLCPAQIMAQSVFAATETIDKATLPGLSVTLPIEEKYVSKAWEDQLRGYGRVNSSRGTFRVSNANVPAVSPEPINLTSQVKGSKKSTTVFVSMDLGNQVFASSGTPQYTAAETMLKEFGDRLTYEQTVREAEDLLSEAQKNQQTMTRKGEKLQRDLDNNRRDKEKLLKRIDENTKELEQLTKDIETNKTDQANALSDVGAKIKTVEDVKAKKK